MKRALAFGFAVLLFGVAGLAQISGSWSGKIQLVQTPSLVYTQLVLNYSVAGFDITSTSKFTGAGFESQKFGISGPVGPADVGITMAFDATAPAYSYTEFESKISFAGVDIATEIFHGVYPYAEDDSPIGWVCDNQTSGQTLMLYTFKTAVDPVTLQVRFLDCCDGIEFYDFYLWLQDLSLCCGIAYDFELYFTKKGFEHALFSIYPLFELCCNISVGVDVKFTVDAKSVTPTFTWGGIAGCVTVYGDITTHEKNDLHITGWELYGYKISCELEDCYGLEFGHTFDVTNLDFGILDSNLGEFEYLKFTACGPSCCGAGNWNLEAYVFFGSGGSLFDITRYTVDISLPIMDALTLGLSFESPSTIYIGWTLTF